MNEVVKKAKEKDQFRQELPDVEIGDIVNLRVIWDGNGEMPTESYSYILTDDLWINYSFESLVDLSKDLTIDSFVRVIDISLI